MEIIPNVYQIRSERVNIYLIAEEGLTLIDTGFRNGFPLVAELVHRLGRSLGEIHLVFLTHSHFDHIGGLAMLKKATPARIAAHQADMRGAAGQPYPFLFNRMLSAIPFAGVKRRFYIPGEMVDLPLAGGEVFPVLGGLQVIHTPGHTPGSFVLYAPGKRLLFAGDALLKRGDTPRLQRRHVNCDDDRMRASVRVLAGLDFDILCLGHGRPLIGDAGHKVRELVRGQGL